MCLFGGDDYHFYMTFLLFSLNNYELNVVFDLDAPRCKAKLENCEALIWHA